MDSLDAMGKLLERPGLSKLTQEKKGNLNKSSKESMKILVELKNFFFHNFYMIQNYKHQLDFCTFAMKNLKM